MIGRNGCQSPASACYNQRHQGNYIESGRHLTNREISIAFQTDKRAGEYVALAKLANQYAFNAVTVYCDAPYHPQLRTASADGAPY